MVGPWRMRRSGLVSRMASPVDFIALCFCARACVAVWISSHAYTFDYHEFRTKSSCDSRKKKSKIGIVIGNRCTCTLTKKGIHG